MSYNSGDLIRHPEIGQLLNAAAVLTSELADLLTEYDLLRFHTCKVLQADYMRRIGVYEYKLFEWDCQIRRTKRKIELIQAQLNRQQDISLAQIDRQLNEEYEEYSEQIQKKADEIEQVLKKGIGTVLSDEESKEIKILYRKLMKMLHPDWNPDANSAPLRQTDAADSAAEHYDP